MSQKNSSLPRNDRLGNAVLLDKQGLLELLAQYESCVKEKREILPFVDYYFEAMRRLNLAVN